MSWRSKLKKRLKKGLKKTIKTVVTGLAIVVGAVGGLAAHKDSPAYYQNFAAPLASWCNPVGNLSEPPKYFVLKLQDGTEYAIPANAIPANAIPANIREAWAIPANAIPANAIPANAIPANFWNYAIPANAIPANAIPSNAIPANAIPANMITLNAIPANQLSNSFLKTDSAAILDLVDKAAGGKALPSSAVVREFMVSDITKEALSSDANLVANITLPKNPLMKAMRSATCQSDPQPSLLQKSCASKGICLQTSKFYGLVAYQSRVVSQPQNNSLVVTAPQQSQPQSQSQNPPSGVEIAGGSKPDRCSLFSDAKWGTYIDWTQGQPLTFYIVIPGGVPGQEREISGDNDPWDYSATIGNYSTQNCKYMEGYSERLYCQIDLPKEYANSMSGEIKVFVNDCEGDIFHKTADIPAFANAPSAPGGTGSESGGSSGAASNDSNANNNGSSSNSSGSVSICGPEPNYCTEGGAWSSWCECMHYNAGGCPSPSITCP